MLVPTGRGQFVWGEAHYNEVLGTSLSHSAENLSRRMLVNAKCAPHYIKTVLEQIRCEPDLEVRWVRPRVTLSGGAGGCPAGTRYSRGDTAERRCHPCPYLPVFAENSFAARSCLRTLWTSYKLFTDIRRRTSLGDGAGNAR